ncbi:hypothetical protein EYF80_039556 [Liparis tanakae]|uniref:Uncharacterized protein n=1 Tax=Liparis tanakae TaxID=230148 RepID=A0A4Z2GAM7_9TELE|nr:hypothetical protein EYF80_039556 [Liparis tanakae]
MDCWSGFRVKTPWGSSLAGTLRGREKDSFQVISILDFLPGNRYDKPDTRPEPVVVGIQSGAALHGRSTLSHRRRGSRLLYPSRSGSANAPENAELHHERLLHLHLPVGEDLQLDDPGAFFSIAEEEGPVHRLSDVFIQRGKDLFAIWSEEDPSDLPKGETSLNQSMSTEERLLKVNRCSSYRGVAHEASRSLQNQTQFEGGVGVDQGDEALVQEADHPA